jgi:hypothetical protein
VRQATTNLALPAIRYTLEDSLSAVWLAACWRIGCRK